jgi:hypothetical protein
MQVGDMIYVRGEHSFSFRERKVVGETSRSWLVKPLASLDFAWEKPTKLPKNGKGWVCGTPEEAKLWDWANAEKYRIGTAVQNCSDQQLLLQVAKIIGYKRLPGEEHAD